MGGLTGAVPLGAFGVEVAIDPPDAGAWVAAIPLVMTAGFLPAVWASVTGTPKRRSIQRATVVWCLAIALVGTLLFGPGIAVLLVVPTTLLAIASGLVWQGKRPSG